MFTDPFFQDASSGEGLHSYTAIKFISSPPPPPIFFKESEEQADGWNCDLYEYVRKKHDREGDT